ncbi:MAG: S-adenosylmethionine:tRNA ribosyltransferase-isomerase [Solirubrobacteraceae bacterium]|nr:S-adenosylmethionine:tRNA ribosyltransferase-isomerase [Solirubrobacteraceae bacterium]
MSTLAFAEIAPALAPPEALGRSRSDVALLVASRSQGTLAGARFEDLPALLRPDDLLVVNTSATIPAALPATVDGAAVRAHLSTPLGGGRWVVEVRTAALGPLRPAPVGAVLELPDGGRLELLAPYLGSDRLCEASLDLRLGVDAYLARHGEPIRYADHGPAWPLDVHQTVFAREPGSAEMPSAARPFTHELVTELATRGIRVAPIVLHCGVSSPERGEPPYPERYRVPRATAAAVDAVRGRGGRVIAVGTTVVRALETGGEGWTSLVVDADRELRAVDGLITGWHEPESSHLLMLEAIAGRDLLERAYAEAAARGLRGHEFGDALLILP